jgi:hypothetical protein
MFRHRGQDLPNSRNGLYSSRNRSKPKSAVLYTSNQQRFCRKSTAVYSGYSIQVSFERVNRAFVKRLQTGNVLLEYDAPRRSKLFLKFRVF